MGSENVMSIVALGLVFGTGVIIAVSISWHDHRTRSKALEVLRVYAERGEEPPASVVQALTAVSGWGRHGSFHHTGTPGTPRPPATRAMHFAHAAANAVTALGLAGLAWWRVTATGEAGGMVIAAFLVALFFAASLAARLVGAYYAAD